MNLDIKVNYQSSICLGGEIYFDPLNIDEKLNNAKIVFITHTHWDHLDEKSIKNVANKETVFVCPQDAVEKLIDWGFENEKILSVEPNQKFEVLGVICETFPAYNINQKFHPKENGWVGYVVTFGGVTYAICGDTDVTEELKKVKTDVIFVPIGGTYTMDAVEASELVNIVKPKLVVPVHYGAVVGDKNSEITFLKNLDSSIEYLLALKV